MSRGGWLAVLAVAAVAVGAAGCGRVDAQASRDGRRPDVFTPAHATFSEAVRDFFGVRPTPRQPIEFPHKVHVAQGLKCTEYCHESVVKGPVAGLPSVNTCMICHDAIATDRPLIQKITKEYSDRKLDIPWQRVFGYTRQAHVRFNHASHIRANVDCAMCHGNIAGQTVAQRNVDLNMGFCVDCHRRRQVSVDCLTCHF